MLTVCARGKKQEKRIHLFEQKGYELNITKFYLRVSAIVFSHLIQLCFNSISHYSECAPFLW